MTKLFSIALVVVLLTGCSNTGQLDQIMGRTEGTPVPEPNRIDCDLIFPGPDSR